MRWGPLFLDCTIFLPVCHFFLPSSRFFVFSHLTNGFFCVIIGDAHRECPFGRGGGFHMRVWRNWQTRKIQVLMVARLCRFKSCYPHQNKRRDPRGLSFCFARGSRDCTCTSFRRWRKKRIKHRSIPLLLFCRGGVGTPPARKTLTFSSSYHKIQIADPGKRSAHQSGRARDRHSAKKRGHRHSGTAQKSTDPAKRSGAAGAQAL